MATLTGRDDGRRVRSLELLDGFGICLQLINPNHGLFQGLGRLMRLVFLVPVLANVSQRLHIFSFDGMSHLDRHLYRWRTK